MIFSEEKELLWEWVWIKDEGAVVNYKTTARSFYNMTARFSREGLLSLIGTVLCCCIGVVEEK